MNRTHALALTAVFGFTGCAGYESTDAEAEPQGTLEADTQPQGTLEADTEQYRISVEIPVDDVHIGKGENLDVDALLTERTAFNAADFHLLEVVLVARSRSQGAEGGGSAELIVDEWVSGAIDVPQGTGESWYEVRIPALVTDTEPDWVVDFTGALDLNLLVAVLEPRPTMLAQAGGSVRQVAVVDGGEAETTEPVETVEPVGEVVHAVEVVEAEPEPRTQVHAVAVVEQPVYRTRTVYRVVDRPVHTYSVSWVYDPARYYVFRDYGGWTYRYFPGTWDWRCYDLSFRLQRHHRHNRHDHRRSDRYDRRRDDRHDGRPDRRRRDGDRHRGDRDGRDRGRDRRGERRQGNETRAIVARPTPRLRRVDSTHPRARVASRRDADGNRGNARSTRVADRPVDSRRLNPFQRRDPGQPTTPIRVAEPRPVQERADSVRTASSGPGPRTSVRSARTRAFDRRAVDPSAASRPSTSRATAARNVTPTSPENVRNARTRTLTRRDEPFGVPVDSTRQPASRRMATLGADEQPRSNARVRSFQRRSAAQTPAPDIALVTVTRQQRQPAVARELPVREDARPSNPRTQVFQRETERRSAVRTVTRSAEPRRTPESRRTVPTAVRRQRSVDERSNAPTRAFQPRHEQRATVSTEPRNRRPESRPRSVQPTRSTPPVRSERTVRPQLTRQVAAPTRPQRAMPRRSESRPVAQRQAPARREAPPAQPQKPGKSDKAGRQEQGTSRNARTRAFERR